MGLGDDAIVEDTDIGISTNAIAEKAAATYGEDGAIFYNVIDGSAAGPMGDVATDYVVFNPTQIKSATDNNGQFLVDDPNVYHQFAGENAETADKMKLAEAQRMEAEGKAPDEIYKATGWFKGLDGKWRFEIPDNLDKIDFAEVEGLHDEHMAVALGRVYDNPALYEAYPGLEEIPVLKKDLPQGTRGQVESNAGEPVIVLNATLLSSDMAKQTPLLKMTLVHEIQHVIQKREGFAGGGNPETVRANILREIDRIVMLTDWKDEDLKKIASLQRRVEETGDMENGDTDQFFSAMQELAAFEKSLPKDKQTQIRESFFRTHALQKAVDSKSDFDLYERLGGEQEAREAADRAESGAYKTMPHPHRYDALIVFGGKEMPYSQNVDNLGENMDNRRGSDGMDTGNPRKNENGEWVTADGEPISISNGYSTESGKDINAANPKEFIVRPDGSKDFGEVTAEVSEQTKGELPQGKIRLRVGDAHEGLVHAKKHEANAIASGYNNIEDAIADVTENYDLIYRRDGRQGPSYTLVKLRDETEPHNMTASMYLDLYPDGEGNYYIIIGAMPKRDRSLRKGIKKEHLIYHSPAIDAAAISSDGAVSAPSGVNAGAARDGLPTSDKSSIPLAFTVPRGGGNVNEKTNSIKANESRSDIQGGFSDGEILNQNAGKVTRGRIWRDRRQGKKIIQLLSMADRSTFLHEMGHLFLMDLEDLAAMGDEESQRMLDEVDDWAKWQGKGDAKKYVGTAWAKEFADREAAILEADQAGDLLERDALMAAWRHERFARAWEIYLMEGTAPSKGLRAVFRKFKSWLRKIYNVFLSDGARASKDVEKVMARLIASEEEIERMEADARYTDFEAAGGAKLLKEDAKETFARWQEEAREEAKTKIRREIMKDLKGKRAEDWEKEMAAARAQITEELRNQPIYLARRAIEESGDPAMWKIFFDTKEAYVEADKAPSLEDEVAARMDEYEREADKSRLDAEITDEDVENALSSAHWHQRLVELETQAFAKKLALTQTFGEKQQNAVERLAAAISEMEETDTLEGEETEQERFKAAQKAVVSLKVSGRWNKELFGIIQRMENAQTKEDFAAGLKAFREAKKEQEKLSKKDFDTAFQSTPSTRRATR